MPQFTRITKVGAFSDDVAKQINDNFAQLGTVMMAHGIDPHEDVKNPDPKAEPKRERSPLDTPQPPPEPGVKPVEHQPAEESDDDDKSSADKSGRGRHAGHK